MIKDPVFTTAIEIINEINNKKYKMKDAVDESFTSFGLLNTKIVSSKQYKGIDVITTFPNNEKVGIQCDFQEKHNHSISFNSLSAAYLGKKLYHLNKVLIITNGKVSNGIRKLANKIGIDCHNSIYLLNLIVMAGKIIVINKSNLSKSKKYKEISKFIKYFHSFKKLNHRVIYNHDYKIGELINVIYKQTKKYHSSFYDRDNVISSNKYISARCMKAIKPELKYLHKELGLDPILYL